MADLRSRQADARLVVHGFEHIVDQLLKSRFPDLARINRK
jgi:hypothetical protein